MKALLKPVLAAGLILTSVSPMVAAPAYAQAVKGIGVVDINNVVANSAAFKVSEQQRPVTYKAQFDQANQRATQMNTQLEPLVKKFEADRQAANPNQQALEQQAATIEQLYQQGQREVASIMAPAQLSRTYVAEQIGEVLPRALEAAAKKRGVTLVLSPEQVHYADTSYSIDQAVIAELNALLPTAQLVPPAGWLPRQMREQQAAQQGVAAPGATAAPAVPDASGR